MSANTARKIDPVSQRRLTPSVRRVLRSHLRLAIDINKTEGVCGGSACVGDTRIPVWVLVNASQIGITDEQLLRDYPTLTRAHLEAAWAYYVTHRKEIDREIAEQDE